MTQYDNPMGTNGFAFLELTTNEPALLEKQLDQFGFDEVGKHKQLNIKLYRQGDIYVILNLQKESHAAEFANLHGASICSMAFSLKDAKKAYQDSLAIGAKAFTPTHANHELDLPAIVGIGGSLIYFVDEQSLKDFYLTQFNYDAENDTQKSKAGLMIIDHLTHNVRRGEMDKWYDFYVKLFNFREIRFFDIKGKFTGLYSRALTSPCGKIRIPLNESSDEKSQIEEFIREFKGEGIQHVALTTENIYETVSLLKKRGLTFLNTPDTYYEMIESRVPWHTENLSALKENKILLDGTKTPEGGLLLQIFTSNMLGPVFFEIIQRKGNEGFGEGNFQALFEAIERDQINRGVLNENGELAS